jgi:hypothetical protein
VVEGVPMHREEGVTGNSYRPDRLVRIPQFPLGNKFQLTSKKQPK